MARLQRARRGRLNPRLVKIHRTYTVEETARVLGAHRNTVRHWLKAGLQPIDDQRPVLILGQELRRFLEERRAHRRRRCAPGEFYCLRCRDVRLPAGHMADYRPVSADSGNLQGICSVCDALMNRRVVRTKLDEVRGDLEIAFVPP